MFLGYHCLKWGGFFEDRCEFVVVSFVNKLAAHIRPRGGIHSRVVTTDVHRGGSYLGDASFSQN